MRGNAPDRCESQDTLTHPQKIYPADNLALNKKSMYDILLFTKGVVLMQSQSQTPDGLLPEHCPTPPRHKIAGPRADYFCLLNPLGRFKNR